MKGVLLVVSGGHAEDAIGARLLDHLPDEPALAFPLVGAGRAYARHPRVERVGPRWEPPSGGFPANSLQNLVADLRSGFLQSLVRQWATAQRLARDPRIRAVAAVGDAYALAVAWRASGFGRRPLFHLQPQISYHYIAGRSLLERLANPGQFLAEDYFFYERWLHRYLRAVYVRDPASERRARALGMTKARFVGSLAMDMLGPPEGPLPVRLDRPVLALLPGTRADVRVSLPLMVRTAERLPEFLPLVAWVPPFEEARLPEGYRLQVQSEAHAVALGGAGVHLIRGRFSAILHAARVALGTAGTANEQAVGLGVPVVAFPTPGPQYTRANARRQKRLLGDGLTLVEADPESLAQAVRRLAEEGPARRAAQAAGRERVWPPGALPRIACEIRATLSG